MAFFNKYPYTDFHELNLDWIISTVKKLTEDWIETLEEWNNTKEQWLELYNYVHDYFDNLDVQEEINHKIDEMILDGTFVTITTPVIEAKVATMVPGEVSSQIGNVVASQIDDVVASQIDGSVAGQISTPAAAAAAAWLADHIIQPTTPAIDNTLSVVGAAADAAQTGIVIASVYDSTETYNTGDYVLYNGDLYQCKIDITTAEAWNSSHWIKTSVGDEVTNADRQLMINDFDLNGNSENISFYPVIIKGEKVTAATGVISDDPTLNRSTFTPIFSASAITFSILVPNICLYTKDKEYISGATSLSVLYNIPGNAYYFIITTYPNYPTPKVTLTGASPVREVTKSLLTTYSHKLIQGSQFPGNLVDPFSCIDNHYVDYATGKFSGLNTNYFCTGYIPVTAGTTYKSNVGRNPAWYDSNKDYISGVSGTTIQSGVTAPVGAEFIVFSINKNNDHLSDPFSLYFTDLSSYSLDVTIPNLITTATPWCYNKKINWIGDSIVAGSDFDEYVTSEMGLIETDYGINGSTIALAGDGTDARDALCARYTNMSDDTDLIAVSCGTNDFQYAWCPIGTINDPDDGTSNNTFYGALKTLCKGLIDKYPKKVIFFTTPIKRAQSFSNGDGGTYTPDNVMTTPFSKNKYGLTLGDYADIIKEVCGYYSIPVLDMYNESLLNPSLTSQQDMFDAVLTHPNTDGQKIMARRVCAWLNALGYIIS